MWGSLIGSGAMTALFGYIYFFVGSARDDAAVQMIALYFLTMGFLLGALAIAYSMAVEQVRWNDTRIQQRTLLFQNRDLCWNQLAAFGLERWSGYAWISDCDGNKLRFWPYCNGVPELISMIAAHLPTDLPPAEAVVTIERRLFAFAKAAGRHSPR
jgi:hypothetical protein